MKTLTAISAVRDWRRQDAAPLGLVPTMGYLHAGHRSLLDRARRENDRVAASLFVNPAQFGPREDLARYPRDLPRDQRLLEEAGCDVLFAPSVEEMYPPGFETTVDVGRIAAPLEGARRPGHFRAVATVVLKLLDIFQPARAYFGEKDWQQLQVVTRMVADLRLPLQIVGVPTVREPDGLALSSRNRFILPEQRETAARLFAVLQATAHRLSQAGVADPVLHEARESVARAGFAVDYVALVDGPTLAPLPAARPPARLIAAARLGSVRLIDNIPV